MERIVASYHLGDHTVDVIEIIDDDGGWTELAASSKPSAVTSKPSSR